MKNRGRHAVQAALIVACLGLHLATRVHATRVRPIERFLFYPEHYAPALSLLGGRGFTGLALAPEVDPRPEAGEVRAFLSAGRAHLDSASFERYLEGARTGQLDPLSASRILDVRIAAMLWRVTGPSWPALLTLYSVVTTIASGLAFVLGCRLGGFRAGLLASLLLLASPFESAYVVTSVRDLSPHC